jgi:tetratricopeptide (TPR) repeat protein
MRQPSGLAAIALGPQNAVSKHTLRFRNPFGALLLSSSILTICTTLAFGNPPKLDRAAATKIVVQIQRADYEGDRAALKRLYADLTPDSTDKHVASRFRYWRGFAMWRRAQNGFNESADPKELEADLQQAVVEFNEALELDPDFVDAKVGDAACFSNLAFLKFKRGEPAQDLLVKSGQLLKEGQAQAPENPRLFWVLGANLWYAPPQYGGGQDKAFETYQKGLELSRKQNTQSSDVLEPSWGEPELLMNLAWANLHRTAPDLDAADRYAHSALQIVPYWHYVRDILIPQINDAKAKSS